MLQRFVLPLSCLGLLALGCGPSNPPPAAQPASSVEVHDSAIPWFNGTVDEAFALAKQENLPVFLYWGAVWCPPCHYLKTKVFARPEVVARLQSFVPVYLDGDTERAQTLGEHFSTQGYPTVIVFAPDGREVARIDSMLPVEHYVTALDSALSVARPLDEVIAEVVRQGPSDARPEDLRLLAFYSWSQAPWQDEDRGAIFERLWRETPEALAVERARFLSLTVQSLADSSDDEGDPAALDEPRRTELRTALRHLLDEPSLRRANLDLLLYGAKQTIDLLGPAGDPARATLIEGWRAALQAVGDDESAAVDDRLTAIGTELDLAKLESDEVPTELLDRVRHRVAWAAAAVSDESELQAVLSTMAAVLSDAGLDREAEALLREKLPQTVAPWYFTSFLASLRHQAGDDVEAVALYREAWQSAAGSASRFRWGSIYLRRAMELAGDDQARIQQDLGAVLNELLTQPDAFSGGNWSRLEQLGDAATEWAADQPDRGPVLDGLRQRVGSSCRELPAGAAEQQQRCAGFLASS